MQGFINQFLPFVGVWRLPLAAVEHMSADGLLFILPSMTLLIGYPNAGIRTQWTPFDLAYRRLLLSCDTPRARKRLSSIAHKARHGNDSRLAEGDRPAYDLLRQAILEERIEGSHFQVAHNKYTPPQQPSCYQTGGLSEPVFESKREASDRLRITREKGVRAFLSSVERVQTEVDSLGQWASRRCWTIIETESARQESELAARAIILEILTNTFWIDDRSRLVDSSRWLGYESVYRTIRCEAVRAARKSLRGSASDGLTGDGTSIPSIKIELTPDVNNEIHRILETNFRNSNNRVDDTERLAAVRRIRQFQRERISKIKKQSRPCAAAQSITSLRRVCSVLILILMGESFELASEKLGFTGDRKDEVFSRALSRFGILNSSLCMQND